MSDREFINLDIAPDAEAMAQAIYDYLSSSFPGWAPAAGNVETRLADGTAALYAEVADLMSVVGEEIFRGFGQSVVNIPPIAGAKATATSTWTAQDNAGYTIAAGTLVGLRAAGDSLLAFEVESEVVIPPGSTATAAGAVSLRALQDGTGGNDLAGPAEMIDALGWVDSVVLVADTSGGVDAETNTDYLNRLSEELSLMTPRPIVPRDFEVLARRNGSVHRALALDGWNPTAGTTGNERYVGLVLLDEDGADVDAGVKTEVEERLDAMREANFVVDVGAPTFTAIDVTATVQLHPGFDPTAVDAAVTDRITEYLQPYNWGTPNYSGLTDPSVQWENKTVVRYLDIWSLIDNVPGVDYPTALTVEGGTVNVNLSGTVPVTQPGTIAVTALAA